MIDRLTYENIIKKHWITWKDYDEAEKTEATFCNMFIRDCVTELCGIDLLKGMMANQIYDYLAKYATRLPATLDTNSIYREDKVFSVIIAARKAPKHGHVTILLPEKFIWSGKWGQWVPKCANIGSKNMWDIGINFAFKETPDYFALDLKI